jgi:predicted esterase
MGDGCQSMLIAIIFCFRALYYSSRNAFSFLHQPFRPRIRHAPKGLMSRGNGLGTTVNPPPVLPDAADDDVTISTAIVDHFFSQNSFMNASKHVQSIREHFDAVPDSAKFFVTMSSSGCNSTADGTSNLLRRKFVQYTWIKGGDLFLDPFPPKILSPPSTTYSGKGCQRRVGPGLIEEIFDVGSIVVRGSDDVSVNELQVTTDSYDYSYIRYRVLNPSLLRYPVYFHEGCVIFSRTGKKCLWAVQWEPFAGLQWYVKGLTSIVIKNLIRNFQANVSVTGIQKEGYGGNDQPQNQQKETVLEYDPATKSMKLLDTITKSTSLRILALHGKGGSGSSFYQHLSPLLEQLSGNKVEIASTNNTISVHCDCPTAPFPEGKWWEQRPPGSRSYNAESYEGYEKAMDMVRSTLSLEAGNNYDVLLGHSQGAILIASMLANKDLTDANTPPMIILNGVAWPNPFGHQLKELKFSHSNGVKCTKVRVLLIMGECDQINPIQGAVQVRDCLQNSGFEVSTIVHSGGHSLPTKNEMVAKSIINWMMSSSQ